MAYEKGKLAGKRQEWYVNEQKKEMSTFKKGLLNGKFNSWYENGQIKEEGYYAIGSKLGDWREYYENSKLKEYNQYVEKGSETDSSITTWVILDSTYTDDHIKNGVWKKYNENGLLSEEGNFEQGKLLGKYKKYWSNGNIQLFIDFAFDLNVVQYKKYYMNGGLYYESLHHTDNDLIKYVSASDENDEVTLKKGNSYMSVDFNHKFRKLTEKDSLPNGVWSVFEDERLTEKGTYLNGFLEGSYFYANDTLIIEGEYTFGVKTGERFFKKDPVVQKSINYLYNDSVDYIVTEFYESGIKHSVKSWKG